MKRAMAAAAALAVLSEPSGSWAQEAASHQNRGAQVRETGPWTVAAVPDARDRALLARCGPSEGRLHAVAGRVVEGALQGKPAPSAVELGEMLRDAGEPHAKARAWTYVAPSIDRTAAAERMGAWLESLRLNGFARCGVASGMDSRRGEAIAIVVVDVLADLQRAIPAQVRPGAWVTVDAITRAPATGAKVVVLGPRGLPRTVPTSFDPSTGQIVARFRADTSGAWLLQVLATLDVGPLPVLEARLHAGADGGSPVKGVQTPGESAAPANVSAADALAAMLGAARDAERLVPLERDAVLDRVADDHVQEMMRAGVVGHDVGDGLPPARVAEAGLQARESGENVAKAPTAILAHRALWWSASHRANMLHERYRRVGVAARRDARGLLWVTQVFAD